MKKIINGKIYNTETAKMIGEYSEGQYGNLNYWEEILYQTKKGQYFICFNGGALSKYSQRIDSSTTSGSEGIRLLDEKEAKVWSEKYLDADQYINIFGEIEEG